MLVIFLKSIFNKNHVRLDNIGIANEFIFTQEVEDALKQNVPLNLVELDDNYYINIQSVLLDELTSLLLLNCIVRVG